MTTDAQWTEWARAALSYCQHLAQVKQALGSHGGAGLVCDWCTTGMGALAALLADVGDEAAAGYDLGAQLTSAVDLRVRQVTAELFEQLGRERQRGDDVMTDAVFLHPDAFRSGRPRVDARANHLMYCDRCEHLARWARVTVEILAQVSLALETEHAHLKPGTGRRARADLVCAALAHAQWQLGVLHAVVAVDEAALQLFRPSGCDAMAARVRVHYRISDRVKVQP